MDLETRGYRSRALEFDGGEPAILLVHGIMLAGEDWVNRGYADRLAPAHRVVAPDLVGFGGSDKPHDADAYGLDGWVADLVAVLDRAEVERTVVWGYSMGATVAEAFARQHPERTDALILGGNLVGLTAADRHNIYANAAAYPEMGWDRIFTEVHPYLDDDARRLFRCRNDLDAVALAAVGCARPHAGDGAPLPARTLNYAGGAEPWHDVAAAVAESLDVPFATIPDADHSQAFRAVDVAVPLVEEFLTR
jgi:pimeloyl-ACP methyl ester carboxylesterase